MGNIAITGSQITAARALTEISQVTLAAKAQVGLSVLVNLEARRNVKNEPDEKHHPGVTPMTRVQFFRDREKARYSGDGSGRYC